MGCFEAVEMLYGNTPDVLSQLIRTMLVPKEGCEFIVADFSAIEPECLHGKQTNSGGWMHLKRGQISTVSLPARCSMCR